MPAVSKAQQLAAGRALAAKRGTMLESDLEGSSLRMFKSMTENQLKDFSTSDKAKLPDRVHPKKTDRNIRRRR